MDQSFITSPYLLPAPIFISISLAARARSLIRSFQTHTPSVCLYFMGSTKQLTYPQAASLVIRKTRKIKGGISE